MDFPFIGGRVKPDELTENLCRNLNLKLDVKETSSLKKAWKNVVEPLSEGKVVGLKLDCYHLEYFTDKIHFAGHYASMYGFDDQYAYLNDTEQQGCDVKTSLENLALARNEKGPMSSRNKSFTIEKGPSSPDLNEAIRQAINNNARAYLNPPIQNFCYKGIKKTAKEIYKWYEQSNDIKGEFQLSATLMERAGTGGALFRNLYRDFLKESAKRLKDPEIKKGHQAFTEIAVSWTEIADLFNKVGETKDTQYLDRASAIFLELSEKEKETMDLLERATA